MGDLISQVVQLTQLRLAQRLAFSEEMQSMVLEVRADSVRAIRFLRKLFPIDRWIRRPKTFLYIIIWPCVTRTGNYQIHRHDYAPSLHVTHFFVQASNSALYSRFPLGQVIAWAWYYNRCDFDQW